MPWDSALDLLQQLCLDLRQLRLQAGGPSLRDLAGRLGIGKSQLGSILSGQIRQLPDWDVVKGLVEAVRKYSVDRGRLGQVSLTTGVEEFWRPRYAVVEHAFSYRQIQRSWKSRVAEPAPPEPDRPVVPHQLPPAVSHLSGRSAELAALDALIEQDVPAGCAVISAIGGMAGVGKTALAVYWAHQVAGHFPDGQLYVNLRGLDPASAPMPPEGVVLDFLTALGVPAGQIPATAAARVGLYRSLLYGRRMLVVLDNAHAVEQVRPLLPASSGCLVLVTSRSRMAGLIAAEGARSVMLDVLASDAASDLLARRVGRHRVAAEPQAVRDIVELCGRLPLALVIVAAQALTHPGVALDTLAAQLFDSRRERAVMDALAGSDPTTDPRAVFSWSYQTLSPPAARLFRLLSLHPGPDIGVAAAASLVALPSAETGSMLSELTEAALVTEQVPGWYVLHDLLGAYANDLALHTDSEDARRAATIRMLDHYVHSTHAAATLLDPNDDPSPVPLAPPAAGVTPEQHANQRQATAWLNGRRPVLQAVLHHAMSTGFATHAWQLAWSLDTYLLRGGHRHDRLATWQVALRAAERLDNPGARALAHRCVANACIRLDRTAEGLVHNQRALALYQRSGDRAGLAAVHYNLTHLWERRGDYDKALDSARQALNLYRAAGHDRGRALACNAIGWYHCLLGDYARGLTRCRQALNLFRQLGDQQGVASTYDSLGYAHHHLGNHPEAIDCYHEALRLYRGIEDRYYQAVVLVHLSDTLRALGERPAARSALSEAADILATLHHPDAEDARARIAALDESPVEASG
ncbi:MAG: ATP-binding protein [Micromonosporaceae bacterium]